MMFEVVSADREIWNSWLSELPHAHLLQTWEWGKLKNISGWAPQYLVWREQDSNPKAMAMVLQRSLPKPWNLTGLKVLYIPKGPIMDWRDEPLRQQVFQDLATLARNNRAIFMKIDPDVCLGTGYPGSSDYSQDLLGAQIKDELISLGWSFSDEQIQFRNTVLIDLKPGRDRLLAQMKQKTRYNVRLASRKGISIREARKDEFEYLYAVYAYTSLRDGFVIRDKDYYVSLWNVFYDAGMLTPLVAHFENEIVAGLMLFHFGDRSWYMHGMSKDQHREKMPNYLLQWGAVEKSIDMGCSFYDLWGAPDEFNENDGMWGVFKFKEGLGGQVVRTMGAWDLPVRPFWFRLYTQFLPRWLNWMRNRGFARTKEMLQDK